MKTHKTFKIKRFSSMALLLFLISLNSKIKTKYLYTGGIMHSNLMTFEKNLSEWNNVEKAYVKLTKAVLCVFTLLHCSKETVSNCFME